MEHLEKYFHRYYSRYYLPGSSMRLCLKNQKALDVEFPMFLFIMTLPSITGHINLLILLKARSEPVVPYMRYSRLN